VSCWAVGDGSKSEVVLAPPLMRGPAWATRGSRVP